MKGRLSTRLTKLETHVEQHGWSQAVVVRLNPDGSEDWPDDRDGAVQVIYLPQKCATVEERSATVAAPLRAKLRPPGGTSDESADG
jgi:hypothetical protein